MIVEKKKVFKPFTKYFHMILTPCLNKWKYEENIIFLEREKKKKPLTRGKLEGSPFTVLVFRKKLMIFYNIKEK